MTYSKSENNFTVFIVRYLGKIIKQIGHVAVPIIGEMDYQKLLFMKHQKLTLCYL